MKIFSLLTIIRDILLAIKEISDKVAKSAFKRRSKEATDKIVEGDQIDAEKVISDGSGGDPTKHDYDGLRTQDAKKRR